MTTGLGQYSWIGIVVVVALLAFVLYRRGRRLIGHQRFDERRILVRTAIIAVIGVVLLVSYGRSADPALEYESAAGGFVIGAIIAFFALRFTQMGRDERGLWYVPNLYLGIGLIALLVARFAYEYIVVFPQIQHQAEAAAHSGGTVTVSSQPMLHGVLFLVLGYYIVYYAGIVLRAKRFHAEAPTENKSGT
ncbi:MAG: DUF1453 domain-containing protein [Gammaproteobacteria bacterium]